MKFSILNEEEFNDFVSKEKTNNFFQSIPMYRRLKAKNIECYLVGIKEKEKIIAAALLQNSNNFLGKKTFEAIKGFILDYHNYNLIKYFTNEILKFIKSKNGFRLTIDPYIPYVSRDIDGNETKEINNKDIHDFLNKIEYQYLGEKSQVKWTFVLDIKNKTSDELFANFKPNTRNYINKTLNKYELNIKELTYEELPKFKKITSDTSERRNFDDRSLGYYQEMFIYFKDNIKVLIAELDCNKYINNIKNEIKELNNTLVNINDKKKENIIKTIKELENKIVSMENLKKEKGNIISLSGAMFITYGKEIVYLFSGSYKEYIKFFGQYSLQWEMIKYAANNQYERYNFYGIKSFMDKSDPDYGVFEFKKGFNGYVEELLGVFEIGIGIRYKLYKVIRNIKNKF